MATKIDRDMVVTVHYRGTLAETGEEFDSSYDAEPLQFLVGHGQMIPGFEEELMGATSGEKRSFTVGPERAYGPHDPDGIQAYPADRFPEGIEVGMAVEAHLDDGRIIPLYIVEIGEDAVTIDLNHTLAGKNLTFEVEVLDIRAATTEELRHSHAHGPDGHHHH
jgi:FKBP-type peptidyl-prolyl cis-trans isomerase SlyD